METGDWLRGFGLSQYEAAFRENSIDLEVLPKLTAEDLKELGVVSVGHRRRLLAAIEELPKAGVATSTVARPAAARIGEAAAAERRHLTVMIADLVGSTALAARLDPEDMRNVLAAYHQCCAGLIASNGGFVAKYMGDGVLAYFGYPQAHEHDAENAVSAALAIVAAAPNLDTPAGAPLHVRIGVATGIVVVGHLLGSGEAQERGVVGDTPNLAARLQATAEPDGVVIAEGTRELLGNLFELQDLGTRDLKGIARPARAWAALRPSSVADHFAALHGTALTPLVGREEECELLLRRWTRAKSGEGQAVLLSGEAGIGKSRLAAALIERLADEPHTRLRYFCSPQHTDDALFPIIGEMERAARLARDDTEQVKLDKLDALLSYTSTPAEDASLFAEMLSLKNDGRYPAIELAPPQRRQRTLQALAAQIEALTRLSPVLMIFEDAHWSDPTSLEALSSIVDRIRTLNAATWDCPIQGASLAVPATLQASLAARLDRLGSAKEVAQIGAAIGREFPHALLAAVAPKPEEELRSSLDRLVQAGLLFRWGAPPNATYRFKHALVQDAAYGALLREPRRALHARIVETLESQFAEDAERQPALLARHCFQAGLVEKAAGLWGKAGERSLERSALVEAAEQFTRAVDQIASLPSTPALRREQIKLQVALASALMFAKGFAAPESRAAEERARLLIEQVETLGEEPPLELLSVLVGFWVANFFRFNADACRDLAAQIVALAEKQGKSVPLTIGHYFTACSLMVTGDIAEARAHLDRAIEAYDPAERGPAGTMFGLDWQVVTLACRSILLWQLGFPEAALADAERALRDARETGDALTLMDALQLVSWTHMARRDYATAKAVLTELVLLADEKSAAWYKALGVLALSWVSAMTKEGADHIHDIASAWDAYLSTGATLYAPVQRSYLAWAYADIGQFDDARKFAGEAIAASEDTKERWSASQFHRVAGEIELQSPERDMTRAEGHFQRALEIARAQQTRSLELGAATSLARLWREQGRRQEARDLLAPVYAWFTEGFDTPDLKEARALLDELAS